MPAPSSCLADLHVLIAREGPMRLDQYMAIANERYYAGRDPFGQAGDFVTAPEISQMFGELVGLWLADMWVRAGRPEPVHYVELGPGRGTLAVDALRAMVAAGLRPHVQLVETSAHLRSVQAKRLPEATWHDDLTTLPSDGALLLVANEFFDALPIGQSVRTEDGWRERRVGSDGAALAWTVGDEDVAAMVPSSLADEPVGSIVERGPSGDAIAHALGARLARQGGAALVVDYGYAGPLAGDTLQAVSGNAYADPLARPGEQDLSAHVDFTAIGLAAARGGARVTGPLPQGILLDRLGIDERTRALKRRNPDRGAAIEAARARLVMPDAMGTLFKALAIRAPDWPAPAGFDSSAVQPGGPRERPGE